VCPIPHDDEIRLGLVFSINAEILPTDRVTEIDPFWSASAIPEES